MMAVMDNKRILRVAFPFIVIFFISIAISLLVFVQQNLPGSKAADEALSITAVNMQDPLATNGVWEWKLIGLIDQNPKNPVALTYTANWCLKHDSNVGCNQSNSSDFFYKLGTGTITLNSKETITKISHQSVNCGRVEINIQRDGQPISQNIHSTNVPCTKDLGASVNSYGANPEEISQLINTLLQTLLSMFDKDGDIPDDSANPGPNDPPVGGNPQPGDVCQRAGEGCSEAYREACTTGGQPGTKICHKHGVCAAPGSGVQCSWGAGSFCEEECKVGTSITDPVPPVKPPQGPGGGENPQPPEPKPQPADADAQKAFGMTNYLIGRCSYKSRPAVTQHNVTNCAVGNMGTNNDAMAQLEIKYSAQNLGASQIRGGSRVGYNHLQCVGFSEAAVAAATGRTYNGPGGDALSRCKSTGDYQSIPAGTTQPRPNDIVVWGASNSVPFGHVAYVISSTAGSMTVVEANNGCPGCVEHTTYTTANEIANRNLDCFLRKN
ncbi:MAG: CHAP domain protein [Microgenomates bacterium OLB23]|nr:MAG: CHAP domain protein [Microgenomates bacterium OLB23]